MKAAFFIERKTLDLREIKDPVPEAGGMVVEVKACGVCGSDLRRWREGPTGDPVITGHEISGVVSAIGEGMAKYKVGDRIAIAPDVHCGKCFYCRKGLYNLCDDLRFIGITSGYHGGFAEYLALNEEILTNGIIHQMPGSLSFDHAALAEPCSSVLAANDRIGTSIDDVVVVMGGGPIGCIHTAVAHARGARVIISEPSDTRRKLAEAFNPEAMIDPFNEDLDDAVRSMTNGRGADVVVCANPVAATQTQAVEIARKRGKVVLFGGLPKSDPTTKFDGNKIHYEEIEVIGSFSYHPSHHAFALEALERGLIPAEKLITARFPLDEIDSAFETAASGKALKVIVNP